MENRITKFLCKHIVQMMLASFILTIAGLALGL